MVLALLFWAVSYWLSEMEDYGEDVGFKDVAKQDLFFILPIYMIISLNYLLHWN